MRFLKIVTCFVFVLFFFSSVTYAEKEVDDSTIQSILDEWGSAEEYRDNKCQYAMNKVSQAIRYKKEGATYDQAIQIPMANLVSSGAVEKGDELYRWWKKWIQIAYKFVYETSGGESFVKAQALLKCRTEYALLPPDIRRVLKKMESAGYVAQQ